MKCRLDFQSYLHHVQTMDVSHLICCLKKFPLVIHMDEYDFSPYHFTQYVICIHYILLKSIFYKFDIRKSKVPKISNFCPVFCKQWSRSGEYQVPLVSTWTLAFWKNGCIELPRLKYVINHGKLNKIPKISYLFQIKL